MRLLAAALLATSLVACASTPTQGARTAGFALGRGEQEASDRAAMNQAELQQALQRIASLFQTRIGQVTLDVGASASVEQQGLILRQSLLYQSSILDIATGPQPEINLLDMVVFARLGAATLKSYWTSERLGDASAAFSDAFARLERDLQGPVVGVLSPQQRVLLERLIDDWKVQNPDQHVVEGIRFVNFGRVAGQAADESNDEARGLLSSVKNVTRAADRALLTWERTLYLSHREPFLLRTQARLGAREITGDMLTLVHDTDALLQRGADLRPMISETSALLGRVSDVSEGLRTMSGELDSLLRRATELVDNAQLEKNLSTADVLSGRAVSILSQLERLQQSNAGALAQASLQADALIRRWITYCALAVAGCVLFYWLCYYVVKRLLARGQLSHCQRRHSSS